ncbi:MAG TPA: hypothetical protein VED63_03305, partial [Acidimicrobiales bacterium]|nr:hypothetical protein [Acidimicrobiales bacterium]
MTTDAAFPFLTVLVLLPAATALVVAIIPKSIGEALQRRIVLTTGLLGSLATLALAITIVIRYQAGNGSFRMVSQHQWAPS